MGRRGVTRPDLRFPISSSRFCPMSTAIVPRKPIEPLGPDGEKLARALGADAWIAPGISHFPELRWSSSDRGSPNGYDRQAANLVTIREDGLDEELVLEFRDTCAELA